MKKFFKQILIFILDLLARAYILRFKPEIIAITGNVGKTSTKEVVTTVLRIDKNVRASKGNLNNEFGVPLTILGDWSEKYYETGGSIFFWLSVVIKSFFKWFFMLNYPEILVLEFGADKPGDIGYLVKKYRPKIGIVTAVGDIPVHVEYFSDPSGVAREKSKLISGLKTNDYAILNHDDPIVYEMKNKTRARVMTYGFTQDSNLLLSNFDIRTENKKPIGIGFKMNYGANKVIPTTIHDVLGKSQALAAGAAACVGIIYGFNLIEISQAIDRYRSPAGRLKILQGIKNSILIDDTYNSSPSAVHLALDTISSIPAKRKIVVLGDMLELGKYTLEAHREVGNRAASIADILVCVGTRAKFIADSALSQISKEKILTFNSSDEAKIRIQQLITEGDLILVKGSQGMRMEKIVEEIMAEPEKKKDLLVRQGRKWLNK